MKGVLIGCGIAIILISCILSILEKPKELNDPKGSLGCLYLIITALGLLLIGVGDSLNSN